MASLVKVLKQVVSDMKLNSYVGSWSWLLHRVTGIALTFYLLLHIWVLSSARGGTKVFDERLAKVQTPLFHALEVLLLACVLIHGLNGLRVTIIDFLFLTKRQKALSWVAAIIFIVLMIFIVVSFAPRIMGVAS